MSEKRLIIYGCGGHSRSVLDVLLSYDTTKQISVIDEGANEGETLFGFPLSKQADLGMSRTPFFLAIGNNRLREQKYNELNTQYLISIHSPKAHIGKDASIGKGTFIGNFAHLGPECRIGDNTILNTGSIVEHEVVVGAHCHVAPGAIISGRTRLGDLVFVGAGATIRDSISICSNVIIGAGAVVIKNIEKPGIYVGCPATIQPNKMCVS